MLFRFLLTASLLFWVWALLSQIPSGYYDGTEGLAGDNLKNSLHQIIRDHTVLTYGDVKEALKVTDEDTLNSNHVICLYSGWSYEKTAFGNGSEEWNREHVWSKSHGDFGDYPPAGTDLHHLRPADASVNSAKSNRDFSWGVIPHIDGSGPTGCYYSAHVWEPRDEVKGDVARMIFYMAVRYEGENGEPDLEIIDTINTAPNDEPFYGKLNTLLLWHQTDPVSSWEQNRNNIIYQSYQGNRNPFIDHPEFVGLIWDSVAPMDTNLNLIISEVADPNDNYLARFVEIYNAGEVPVYFDQFTWYLSRQANGSNWADILLTGSIQAGETYVVAYSQPAFSAAYGFEADLYNGNITGNGNDGYFLFYNGGHSSGQCMDAFGVANEDGIGKEWEYTDAKAVRVFPIEQGSSAWNVNQWIIVEFADASAMSPAGHKQTLLWTAAQSDDWFVSGNWEVNGSTAPYWPDAGAEVMIDVLGFPAHIQQNACCGKITIGPNGALILEAGAQLNIPGWENHP